ncbi:MAG: carotenoid biosynthesis protein [candidate division WOR-3 bacterium]
MRNTTQNTGLAIFGIAFTGLATVGFMIADAVVRPTVGWLSLMPVYCLAAFALLHSLSYLGTGRALWFLALGLILPYVAEYLGTNFGAVFGSHWFHRVRDLRVAVGLMLPGHVPFSVVLTWFGTLYIVFIVSTYLVRAKSSEPSTIAAMPLTAGFIMALWQLSAGPLAVVRSAVSFGQYGFYHGIPLSSFVGWYATAMFVVLFFLAVEPSAADAERLAESNLAKRSALWMFVAVMLYPTAMCFRFRMTGAGWLGIAVVLLATLAIAIRTRSMAARPHLAEAPTPAA